MKNKIIAMLCTAALTFGTSAITSTAVTAAENTYPTTYNEYQEMLEEYPDFYRIDEDSVYFLNHNIHSMEMSLIVSSNEDSGVSKDTYGYVFTPESHGRYVVTVSEFCEEIVSEPDEPTEPGRVLPVELPDHYHNFYPVIFNYTIDVDNSGISVAYKGTCNFKDWSEPTIDLYRPWETESYNSFVNGQIPDGELPVHDSYITNIYTPYTTESYFYSSGYGYYENMPHPVSSDTSVAKETRTFNVSSYLDGNFEIGTDDIYEMTEFAAGSDGYVSITQSTNTSNTLYQEYTFNLMVKDGIFHHVPDPAYTETIYSVGIEKAPDKTTYKTGEDLELKGLCLNGTITTIVNGSKEISSIMNEDYTELVKSGLPLSIDDSEFDNSKAGTYKIYVKLGDSKSFFNVTVTDEKLIDGDVNDDGKFGISDVVTFQKWLIKDSDTHIANWQSADVCKDGELNVFDLCAMKRKLINQAQYDDTPVLMITNDYQGLDDKVTITTDFIITQNGKRYSADNARMNDWSLESYIDYIKKGTVEQSILEQDILEKINNLAKNAAEYKDCKMEQMIVDTADYYKESSALSLLYTDKTGRMRILELCRLGNEFSWLDNEEVQDVIRELIKKQYFGYSFFNYYPINF